MNVEILARTQFAVTILFHYIYPPLTIGIGIFLVIVEGLYLKTGQHLYHRIARFWTEIFSLIFAIGVTTGIVMEFEFGTNWANYSRYVGDVFGTGLAAEGIFAFFLESGFLALLLFGWDRVSKRTHFFSTVMVCLGSHFSSIWVVVANSWMQTPQGYTIVGDGVKARAEITDFWTMVLNPSTISRLSHVILGCYLGGVFLVISVSSYYILKKREEQFAFTSLKIALIISAVVLPLQLMTGDMSAKIAAKYQPSKFAAMEGIYKSQKDLPLHLFGIPDSHSEKVHSNISIPHLLSLLTHNDLKTTIKGLEEFPKEDWPNVFLVFQSYRMMLASFFFMVVLTIFALIAYRKNSLKNRPLLLKALIASLILPQIANEMGWITAETGRYPWIVYNLLRIHEGLSHNVSSSQILFSLILFTIIYTLLFILFFHLLFELIKKGPEEQFKKN